MGSVRPAGGFWMTRVLTRALKSEMRHCTPREYVSTSLGCLMIGDEVIDSDI